MNPLSRQGENNKTWNRMTRYYNINGKWFFATREKTEFGPFYSLANASKGLEFYLVRVGKIKFNTEQLVNLVQGDPWQITQYK